MADDRPAEDPTEALARMQRELDDLRSTVLVRVGRCPTGTIEGTILAAAKTDTLILDGSTKNRADYPVLWQWVLDNARVATGLFTVGNGSTTFGLPDFRGRVLVGATPLVVGAKIGADTVTLATANMPSHDHNASATTASSSHTHASDALHSHSISADASHAGHNSGVTGTSASFGSGVSVATSTQNTLGSHSHGGGTAGAGSHSHDTQSHSHTVTVSETLVGSGTPIDARPPSIAINYLIYT